ncbi:MAG: hypothetical protein MRJ92_06650 [Nitrospira sp.]|nr:hypothetical protein [Nitrospira sp.]
MTDIQGNGPDAQRRVELTWNLNHRHSLRFVYAPLGFSGTGSFGVPVRFAGGTFAPGVPVDSEYKFDSYRLTYRYLLHDSERWRWRIGATAFIRDARVELRQQGTVADSNVGFVPLLSSSLEYDIAPRWTALLDFDGLVSTQGRAIDAALKVRYDLTDHWFMTAGYRVFEGGWTTTGMPSAGTTLRWCPWACDFKRQSTTPLPTLTRSPLSTTPFVCPCRCGLLCPVGEQTPSMRTGQPSA